MAHRINRWVNSHEKDSLNQIYSYSVLIQCSPTIIWRYLAVIGYRLNYYLEIFEFPSTHVCIYASINKVCKHFLKRFCCIEVHFAGHWYPQSQGGFTITCTLLSLACSDPLESSLVAGTGVPGIFLQTPKYTPGIFWLSKHVPLVYCILCDKSNFTT